MAGFTPLVHDCIDEGYLIERKAGRVVTLPAGHRNAILTDDSQIVRHMPVEQTNHRVSSTARWFLYRTEF